MPWTVTRVSGSTQNGVAEGRVRFSWTAVADTPAEFEAERAGHFTPEEIATALQSVIAERDAHVAEKRAREARWTEVETALAAAINAADTTPPAAQE